MRILCLRSGTVGPTGHLGNAFMKYHRKRILPACAGIAISGKAPIVHIRLKGILIE
jgi:hypothetical protein